jgi:hypothetical protein
MPGPILHIGALITCPHQAPVQAPPTNTRVFVGGRLALTATDVVSVVGCPFTVPGPKPQPCVLVKMIPSTKVLINGQPAAILTPATLCYSAEQIPQGPPNSSATQTRVVAL